MGVVGTNVERKDGIGKATGAAKYADDLSFPGMLYGRTIRSDIAAGRIRSIRYDFDAEGFTIADHADIPHRNVVALIEDDQPFLVEHDVRHLAEPIVLLAHADRATLLALKANRPVKIVYDRTEDMLATTKRHPSIVRHRTGVSRDGTLVAMDVDVVIDGGAYVTLSPVVLSRGGIHAAGPYRCENIRIRGHAMFTNTPPNGAFRGFGAPQTQFAVEAHMDRVAAALGIDPVTLRERNALRAGDTTATGQRLRDDCSALEVLGEAVRRSDFRRKRDAYAGTNTGIGLALRYHGSGFTGSGELRLASKAKLELTATGVRVLVSSTEIGQGTRTMHAQIVADTLGVPYESVEVAQPDTVLVPDSGPTVASRTCMVVGKILERCALELKETLGGQSPAEDRKS